MKICTDCQRYVNDDERACPFCSSEAFKDEVISPNVGRGASRAHVYAARAVIASAALSATAACGDESRDDDPTTETGGQASTGGSEASAGTAMATGGNGISLGGSDARGGEGGEVMVPIYGGPFPDMMKARV